MTLERVLGVAGVLVGLPVFVGLFFDPYRTAAIITLSFAIALGVVAILVFNHTRRPPFRMNRVEVRLDLTNPHQAKLTKSYRIVPSISGLTHIKHRNIAADGKVEKILWDGQEVPAADIRTVMGEYHVAIQFPRAHTRGREFTGTLSYILVDSFSNTDEYLYYVVDFPAKVVRLEVVLPDTRPCTNPEARLSFGGQDLDLPTLAVSNANKLLTLDVTKPRVGATIAIYWAWPLNLATVAAQ